MSDTRIILCRTPHSIGVTAAAVIAVAIIVACHSPPAILHPNCKLHCNIDSIKAALLWPAATILRSARLSALVGICQPCRNSHTVGNECGILHPQVMFDVTLMTQQAVSNPGPIGLMMQEMDGQLCTQ